MRQPGPLERFDEFCFDHTTLELRRDGDVVPLQPLPAQLLALFLSRPGELLSQGDIREALWPATTVDHDQRIRSLITSLRRTLGDEARNPRFIRTVARRGYRFEPGTGSSVGGGATIRRRIALAAPVFLAALLAMWLLLPVPEAGGPAAAPYLIAALPIQTDAPESFPARALGSELIAALSRIAPGEIQVIAGTSASAAADDPSGAGVLLGADLVLETLVHGTPQRDRLIATLKDAGSGVVVGSHAIELSAENWPGAAAAVAEMAAQALGVTGQLAGGTLDPDAYLAYLRGRQLAGSAQPVEARAAFEEAIAHDANFAAAHAELGRLLLTDPARSTQGLDLLARAIALDAGTAQAYFYRTEHLLFRERDLAAADADLQMAIALDPGMARAHGTNALVRMVLQDFEAARAAALLSLRLDPLSMIANMDLGWLFVHMREWDEAERQCRATLALRPDFRTAHECLFVTGTASGNGALAREQAEILLRLDGADEALLSSWQALPHAEALNEYHRFQHDRLTAETGRVDGYSMATVLVPLGAYEEALEHLEADLDSGAFGAVFVRGDPRFDPIRSNPRFQAIVAALFGNDGS